MRVDPDSDIESMLERADDFRPGNGNAGKAGKKSKRTYRFKLIDIDKWPRRKGASYTVKGLFPAKGLAIVWGPPKEGKSFWTMTVMLHVALGMTYRRRRVRQGIVVYMVLEGQEGTADRRDAFLTRYGEPGDDLSAFKLCGARLDLIKDHTALITDIKDQCPHPAVIVIDTLNRSLVGSESSDEDMARYIRAADAIGQAFDCLVVVIHHCGWDPKRPRGHSSQVGAADVLISVKKDAAGNVIATVDAAKDMPEGEAIASRLEVAKLYVDDDGDWITSCVVVEAELAADTAAPAGRPGKGKGKMPLKDVRAELARRALANALAGTDIKMMHIPGQPRAVTIEMWRLQAYKEGFCAELAPDTRKKAFQRAREELQLAGIVGIENDLAWLAKP